MFEVPITLRRSSSPALAATAWMVASDCADDWLEEISRWPVEHTKVQILPLRAEPGNSHVVAALLIPPAGAMSPSRRCLPFVEAAPQVYIPSDSSLEPPIPVAELKALLPQEYLYVWQAAAGLTAVSRDEILSPAQLLAAPSISARDWQLAVPGIAFAARHLLLEPIAELSFESILEAGRDDIGENAEKWEGLPKSPQEPTNGVASQVAQAGLAGLAAGVGMVFVALGGLGKLLSKLGQPLQGARGLKRQGAKSPRAARPPRRSKIGEFLSNKVGKVQKSLEEARNKEVRRLLHLLENDPDRGLRFALPLGGSLHRGVGQPGGRLMERMVSFSLGSLGGGGAVDHWNLSADYQRQLAEQYRALANREMNLGRHRRAAYIFAELLNDLDAAAGALVAGGCFREAAVLYRDRLRRPLDAARCLEQGRLWSEAIEQYAQLQMHEKVGELYASLEQPDQARTAYLAAIEEFRRHDNYVDAARLWETRLDDADQALVELETGWLNSPKPIVCLHNLFATLQRTGQHETARWRTGELVDEAAERRMQSTVAAFLAEIFESYPDRATRDAAAEGATRIIGSRLRAASPSEASQLCSTLARLAPEDLLLRRDARRFASPPPLPRIAAPLPGKSQSKIKTVRSMSLGLKGSWRAAVSCGDVFYAAGIVDGRIVLARADAAGNVDRFATPWPKTSVASDCGLILTTDYFQGEFLGLYIVGRDPLPQKAVFYPTERRPPVVLGGAIPGSGRPLGAALGGQGRMWTVEAREGMVAMCSDVRGNLLSTLRIPDALCPPPDEFDLPLPMHVRSDRVYVAMGACLISLTATTGSQRFEVASPIRSVCGSNPYTLNRIAIGMERGAAVLWDGSGHQHIDAMASEMFEPAVCINRGGYAIAATAERIEAYDTKGSKLTLAATLEQRTAAPVAVLPVATVNRFIVLTEDGTATLFELP